MKERRFIVRIFSSDEPNNYAVIVERNGEEIMRADQPMEQALEAINNCIEQAMTEEPL